MLIHASWTVWRPGVLEPAAGVCAWGILCALDLCICLVRCIEYRVIEL